MRLHVLLPKVNSGRILATTKCIDPACPGRKFRFHQPGRKALRDTVYHEVPAHRYQCLKCGRTFRVYPEGVSSAQVSQRVKGLAVMLYLLGLSYGATALALEAIGVSMCKSRVYDAVQEAACRVPGLKREQVFNGLRTSALGADLIAVNCKGQWLPLGITVDAISGLALTVDSLSAEDIEALKQWVEPIAQSVGAQVLVTDDADGFKTVADEVGVQQQVCKSHVLRNQDRLIEQLKPLVQHDSDGSLSAIGLTGQQATADLERLGELVRSRQREQGSEVEACIGAICKPARLVKASTRVWPIGCGSCFSTVGTSGIA